MIKKLAFPLFLNIAITIILFYTVPLFIHFLSKTYNPDNENTNFYPWMGFIVICFFLLNLLIAYLILVKCKMVKLPTVLIFLGSVVLTRIILNVIQP
jgi:hypothetical protein